MSWWSGRNDRTRHNIAIIGGGASGALFAVQLLTCSTSPLRVILIEKTGSIGRGLAYGAAHPYHLLNVRAANMSAYPERPDHFVRWLERAAWPNVRASTDTRFVPRLSFGAYLEAQIAALAVQFPGSLTIHADEAIDIDVRSGEVRVHLRSGDAILADHCVLATGNELPLTLDGQGPQGSWLSSSCYTPSRGPILFRGTGLTTIDYVQALLAAGASTQLIAISRHGLFSRSHALAEQPFALSRPRPVARRLLPLWREIKRAAREHHRDGGDWRTVIDGLRPHTNEIWRSLPLEDRRGFLRHARSYWDVLRHRCAPEVAAKLQTLVASGALRIIAGRTLSVEPAASDAESLEVTYRRRGSSTIETMTVARVVDCTGTVSDVRKSHNPILQALLAKGLARAHPLNIGLDVTENGALVDNNGRVSDRIYALGPMTRGAAWESTAVPDIRAHAADLARHLRERHEGTPARPSRLVLPMF